MDESTPAKPTGETRECTIEGCGRHANRKVLGLCEAHYYQKRRHGKITSVEIKPYRTPGCKEPGCNQPHAGRGWCLMHYTRWQRHGDAGYVGKPAPKPGSLNPNWQGDSVGYIAVHDRMRSWFGPATGHQCGHCGQQAAQWAYDHTDPAEQYEDGYGPYSTDPARYLPLCVPCHKRFDLARLR